jgi:hypothetical protein
MFRLTRPSSDALKFGGNDAPICVLIFTVFLNEVNVIPPSMPHVLVQYFIGTPVTYQVCSVHVIVKGFNFKS